MTRQDKKMRTFGGRQNRNLSNYISQTENGCELDIHTEKIEMTAKQAWTWNSQQKQKQKDQRIHREGIQCKFKKSKGTHMVNNSKDRSDCGKPLPVAYTLYCLLDVGIQTMTESEITFTLTRKCLVSL